MKGNTFIGQWILTVVIGFFVFAQTASILLRVRTGLYGGSDAFGTLITGYLLWRIWDGSNFARWLVAVLLGLGTLAGASLVFDAPGRASGPGPAEVFALILCGSIALGLMSPWVGAFQAAKRAERDPALPTVPTGRLQALPVGWESPSAAVAGATGQCRTCGYGPVATDARSCPRCAARDPNPKAANNYAGPGMLLGMVAGAAAGAWSGYESGRDSEILGGALLGSLPGMALGLFVGVGMAFLVRIAGRGKAPRVTAETA